MEGGHLEELLVSVECKEWPMSTVSLYFWLQLFREAGSVVGPGKLS